jgi:PPM family protein phosphatase
MNNNIGEDRPHWVESGRKSDQGRKRKNNEDSVAFFEPTDPRELQENGCLYIVADGVGGAARGERVSEYASGKVLYEYFKHPEIEPGERLRQLLSRVNDEVYAFAEQNNTRMATTMVAVVIRGNLLTVANVGDSRAYLIRAGKAQQITDDHSIVGEMVRSGNMTEAEAQKSKAKNRLSRSLGGDPSVHVDIFGDIPLQAGDKILLCTDGLTRYALRDDISQMTSQGSPQEIADGLVNFANHSGGADNVSVIVVAFDTTSSSGPTLRLERLLRQPASWEDMLTEQPAVRQRPHRRRISIPRKYVPYVILGLAILLVAGITVSALFMHFPVLSGNSTMSVAPMKATTTPVDVKTATETVPVDTPTTQAPATPSNEAPPPTQSLPQNNPNNTFLCIVHVTQERLEGGCIGISCFLSLFSKGNTPLKYDEAETYYNCSVSVDPTPRCTMKNPLQKKKDDNNVLSPVIEPNMWLVIPVDDEKICSDGQGLWVPFGPP